MSHMAAGRRSASIVIGLAATALLVTAGEVRAQSGTATGSAPTATAQTPPADPPPYVRFQDNSLSLLYGGGFTVDPSEQAALTIEHVHNSAIGDVFVFADITRFMNPDDDDEWTIYGELSPRLSLGKVFKKDMSFTLLPFSLFTVKDVLIAAQYERGEDPSVAEAVLLGVGFDLDARKAGILGPLGKFNYIQLNVYARAEITTEAEPGFRDMQITMVAAYPFTAGKAKFLFDGYFDWVLGIGSEQSSFHLNPQFKLDLGAFGGWAGTLYAGAEWNSWWNKYQIASTPEFNTNQHALSALVKFHF